MEDFLDEDPEIQGQKWALVSFLSPERVLEEKSHFLFRKFLEDYELKWKTTRLEAWMTEQLLKTNDEITAAANELRKKDLNKEADEVESKRLSVAEFAKGFQDFCRKEFKALNELKMREEYEEFLFKHQEKLEDDFHAKKDFQTTVRGIKIRGVYATEAEAAARARRLQKTDKLFNIYAASVGKWTPWDPDPSKIANQEYAQEQLNTLMKKYNENSDARDAFYEDQKKQRIAKAKAAESGKSLPPMEITVSSDGDSSVAMPALEADASGAQVEPVVQLAGGAAAAAEGAAGAEASSFDGLFSAHGDIVIERKRQAAEAAANGEE